MDSGPFQQVPGQSRVWVAKQSRASALWDVDNAPGRPAVHGGPPLVLLNFHCATRARRLLRRHTGAHPILRRQSPSPESEKTPTHPCPPTCTADSSGWRPCAGAVVRGPDGQPAKREGASSANGLPVFICIFVFALQVPLSQRACRFHRHLLHHARPRPHPNRPRHRRRRPRAARADSRPALRVWRRGAGGGLAA